MRGACLALLIMLGAAKTSAAQSDVADPTLSIAIEDVCRPYVVDGVAETDIGALQEITPRLQRYDLSEQIGVSIRDYGSTRMCTVSIGGDAIESSRALIFEAAARWPIRLDYRGDQPPGIGFVRKEIFCPPADALQTSWFILSRDSGTRLTLGIVRSTTPTRGCEA